MFIYRKKEDGKDLHFGKTEEVDKREKRRGEEERERET